MKTSTIAFALFNLAGFSCAAPRSARVDARQASGSGSVSVTFFGAGPNPPSFVQVFPTDGSSVPITNPLSVSSIFVGGIGECDFAGIDGSNTVVGGGNTGDVGPPQTQVEGVCFAS